MKPQLFVSIAVLAALVGSQTNGQVTTYETGAQPLSAVEFQRRLQVCLEAEDWLRPTCIEALRTLDLISESQPTLDDAPEDVPEEPPMALESGDGTTELHLVGIYEPRNEATQSGPVRRGAVGVVVDRPGQHVALVLNAYEPVLWAITTTPGTTVTRIIIAGNGRDRSEATLNAVTVQVERVNMPLAYETEGSQFQAFHQAAFQHVGMENADSFEAAYTAPETGFTIDAAPGLQTRADERSAIAALARDPSTLPAPLIEALNARAAQSPPRWQFSDEGFTGLNDDDVAAQYDVPLEVPEVSWPMGVAYDPERDLLWGISLGGEGYLYEYDIAADSWLAWSMRNVDAGGLLFDAETDRLITTPAPFGSRNGRFLTMDRRARVIATVSVPLSAYPGLIQTMDLENGPGPQITPLAVSGDQLLVSIEPRHRRHAATQPAVMYLVDLTTGEVELIQNQAVPRPGSE